MICLIQNPSIDCGMHSWYAWLATVSDLYCASSLRVFVKGIRSACKAKHDQIHEAISVRLVCGKVNERRLWQAASSHLRADFEM